MIRRLCLAALAVCVLPLAAMAQDEAASFRANNAHVFDGTGAAPLTLPSQAAPPAVVTNFLRGEGYAEQTVNSLTLESEHTVERTGLTHLSFAQQVGGLTVHGAYLKAAVNQDGELVHLIEALAPAGGRGLVPSIIDPSEALDAALGATHPGLDVTLQPGGGGGNTVTFSGDDFFHQDPSVTRVAIAMESGVLQEGYLVETWTEEDNLLHHTLVGGNGRVLDVELRTNNESYNIFPDHPGNSQQTVVNGPVDPTASPYGWLFAGPHRSISIAGNNVHAYLDRDNSNSADSGGTTISDGNFLAAAELTQEPTTMANQAVAVQNLFYLNNILHDKLYRHGFVEAEGNFQEDNFENGGFGSDSVNAEAQDGGGTNNANFATPSDGSNPRMQMYLWTQSTPGRDGDLDSDIVYHEYCHGLTWRMIGGMSGPMSGAIGEGMSDGCSLLMNGNDVVGEYSYNNAKGIRSAPYTNYPRTYGDFIGDSVHYDGEIYAAIIWDLMDRFETNGITRDTLWDYIVGGMMVTASGPAFEDMRDGILAASLDSNDCLIWESFAKFGVGVGASSSENRKGRIVILGYTITEDFTVPSDCAGSGGSDAPPTVEITNPADGATVSGSVSISANASDDDFDKNGIGVTQVEFFVDGGSIGVDSDSAGGWSTSWDTGSFPDRNHAVTATATDSIGQTTSHSISVTVRNSTGSDGWSLSVTAFKVKGIKHADLTWDKTVTNSTHVDVYRDGVPVASSPNDGFYRDNAGKGGGSATYQVCVAGSITTCSSQVTVTW